MYEELKARLRESMRASDLTNEAAEAIEQLERQIAKEQHDARGFAELYLERGEQLAERDAEIAKYRDAPVVATLYKYHNCFGDVVWTTERSWGDRIPLESKPLIVKPGE